MAPKLSAREAAKIAIGSIGRGYDISVDLRLKFCKGETIDSRLIEIGGEGGHEIVLPGGISIQNVPKSINCDKGERTRFRSDVLSFQQVLRAVRLVHENGLLKRMWQINICHLLLTCLGVHIHTLMLLQISYVGSQQGSSKSYMGPLQSNLILMMSEQFNQEMSLTGKIPSGLFNSMFEFTGSWQKDAANTKTLAFDGMFITLYTVALEKSQVVLCNHVKSAVPSSWEPAALARFIQTFGTHIIVGIKMGGKDVIYMKQQHSSTLQPADVQKRLKEMADKRFLNGNGPYNVFPEQVYRNEKFDIRDQRLRFADASSSSSYLLKEDIVTICKRRGGSDSRNFSHNDWLNTVQIEPDVISMTFIPITSLLSGVPGSGFLSHAINLYLRYRPPIEELQQFLEFQLPRQWAPVFSELPLGPQRKRQSTSSLRFSLLGPKLYVNTTPVDVRKRPVTGMRLYLEGKRSDCLAIHLQHLSTLPKSFQLADDPRGNFKQESYDRRYYEKVQWKNCSHVCTAPVDTDDDLSIVTGAQLQVENYGMKNILFLRLRFSTVLGAAKVKEPLWDGSLGLSPKSGIISTLITHHFSAVQKPPPRPADVNINSAVYPGGPPVPVQAPKLLKFVDTTEMTRGPEETPGYWVISGAKLCVEKGKIFLRVKYSLLTAVFPDEELEPMDDP